MSLQDLIEFLEELVESTPEQERSFVTKIECTIPDSGVYTYTTLRLRFLDKLKGGEPFSAAIDDPDSMGVIGLFSGTDVGVENARFFVSGKKAMRDTLEFLQELDVRLKKVYATLDGDKSPDDKVREIRSLLNMEEDG
jgi:hypothetical protein